MSLSGSLVPNEQRTADLNQIRARGVATCSTMSPRILRRDLAVEVEQCPACGTHPLVQLPQLVAASVL